jgi:putative PIG3 family NAD(P)H quinone oxidoreductase
MRAILYDEEGNLRWGEAPTPEPGPGEVRLRVVSTSVNRADLLQKRGLYPPPPGASSILGLEAAGRVDAVGEGVDGWSVGDEAMALLAGGGYAEAVVADARHLMPVPASLALEDAGAVPEVFLTAWLNLAGVASLSPGERVLIHGGSGGVGTAAIQIARRLGAEVWTTAGSPERCARCAELGAHRAFDYHHPDVWRAARAEGGVDVVLDVIGAKTLAENLAALRHDGRLVVIGLQGGRTAEVDLLPMMTRRLRIVGSTLRPQSADSKAGLVARFRAVCGPALDSGELRPLISDRMALPLAELAHARMLESGHFGKILLTVPDGDG